MESKTMKAVFTLTRRDLLLSYILIVQLSPVFTLIMCSMCLFLTYNEVRLFYEGFGTFEKVMSAVIIFVVYFLILLIGGIFVLILFSICYVKLNRGVLGEHEVEVNDDWLIERTDYNETKYRYNAITRLFKSMGYILIVFSNLTGFAIPMKSFSSKEEAQQFFNYISSKVKGLE